MSTNVNKCAQNPTAGVNILHEKALLPTSIQGTTRARLIDVLLQHHKEPILVENSAFRVILDCAHHSYHGALRYADLLILLQNPCTDYAIKVLTPKQKQHYIRYLPSADLRDAVWTIIMSEVFNKNYSSEPVCPSDIPLTLEAWPNFQTLPHLPLHIALVSYLSRDSKTSRELAKALNVPLNKIQPFLNACLVLGYITQAKESQLFWHNEPPAIIADKPGNLFSRLRQHFLTPLLH